MSANLIALAADPSLDPSLATISDPVRVLRRIGGRHQFRLVLCGHKTVETGAVCLVLMVQGHLMDATLAHSSNALAETVFHANPPMRASV